MNTSPGSIVPARERMIDCTDSDIDPRWTGICGAFATSSPSGSKMAQEKSSRSLMFTEDAVAARVAPICSAADMYMLLKTSSSTGSASVPDGALRASGRMRRSNRLPLSVSRASQSGSTTVVAVSSTMTAGPATRSPDPSFAADMDGGVLHPAFGEQAGLRRGSGLAAASGKRRFPGPVGVAHEFERRRLDHEPLGLGDEAEPALWCWSSKLSRTAASGPNGTVSGESVPS